MGQRSSEVPLSSTPCKHIATSTQADRYQDPASPGQTLQKESSARPNLKFAQPDYSIWSSTDYSGWFNDSLLSGIFHPPASGPHGSSSATGSNANQSKAEANINESEARMGEHRDDDIDPMLPSGTGLLGVADENTWNHRIHLRAASTTVTHYSSGLRCVLGRHATNYLYMHYYSAGSAVAIVDAYLDYIHDGESFIRVLVDRALKWRKTSSGEDGSNYRRDEHGGKSKIISRDFEVATAYQFPLNRTTCFVMDISHPETRYTKRKADETDITLPNKIARLNNDNLPPQNLQEARARSPWTYDRIRLTPPKSGRRISDAVEGDVVAVTRFYGTSTPAMVDKEWLSRLESNRWLSSNQVSFYCYEVGNAYVEGTAGQGMDLVVLHSDAWGLRTRGHPGPGALRHKNAPCPLEHNYIAIPGNETNTHFFLCLILWPSDLLMDVNPTGPVRTTAVILNSMADLQPEDPATSVKRIIKHLSFGRHLRVQDLSDITVHFPRVPQQLNSYDCGLYPGHFLSVFLSDPEKFAAHCTGEVPIETSPDVLWCHHRVSVARKHLRDLIDIAAKIRQASLDFSSDRIDS
ncbi:hypothetical protein FS837_012089 [Tulasnella sp. UAMH 9824]|nr:hypothetical protein FS837_012089 [Tulasnella sp. UAMH 9824]